VGAKSIGDSSIFFETNQTFLGGGNSSRLATVTVGAMTPEVVVFDAYMDYEE
jgi:hypothetical protein